MSILTRMLAREPATIKTELLMINPVNAAAIPEREFSSETTTGISAPPIGNTNNIPSKEETPIRAYITFLSVGLSIP